MFPELPVNVRQMVAPWLIGTVHVSCDNWPRTSVLISTVSWVPMLILGEMNAGAGGTRVIGSIATLLTCCGGLSTADCGPNRTESPLHEAVRVWEPRVRA